MLRKLELSKTPLSKQRSEFRPGKARDFDQIAPDLRRCIEQLCDGQLKWPLLLSGGVGAGKTCAALCVVDRVAGASYWPVADFVGKVWDVRKGRATWNKCGHGGEWTEPQWWRHVEMMPLLVLDDLGLVNEESTKASEWEVDAVFRALDARDGRPVICTCNLTEEEISTFYTPRIASRMCSGTFFELKSRDRRKD